MINLRNLLPTPPWEGPPIPRLFSRELAPPVQAAPPVREEAKSPAVESVKAISQEGDYILSLRKRPKNPTWLKPHQEKLSEASKIASEQTIRLKGPQRVRAMHSIISKLMKQQ